MTIKSDRETGEERFRGVFTHLGQVAAYARRRGSGDADALAAEVMTIAWRRLSEVPRDDPLPWLYATARHLLQNERRRTHRASTYLAAQHVTVATTAGPEGRELDPELATALRELTALDREALLLTAWEGLTPTQAGRALKINPTAFRVRLLRARRRLRAKLHEQSTRRNVDHATSLDMESTT